MALTFDLVLSRCFGLPQSSRPGFQSLGWHTSFIVARSWFRETLMTERGLLMFMMVMLMKPFMKRYAGCEQHSFI
jgi:hypothetical protein